MNFTELLECISKKKDFEILVLPEFGYYIVKAYVGREDDYYTYISPKIINEIIEKVNDLDELEPYVKNHPWFPMSHLNDYYTSDNVEYMKKKVETERAKERKLLSKEVDPRFAGDEHPPKVERSDDKSNRINQMRDSIDR